MAEAHHTYQLALSHALMRSCGVVKMWGLRRKQQRQRIKCHLVPILLQMVKATDQRANRDEGKSCVNIQMVVTSVLSDQPCFAKHMAVESDVNFRMVVTRVLGDQHCFAKPTAVASDVNIRRVATRALWDQQCFA
jgi:hypothetical protein